MAGIYIELALKLAMRFHWHNAGNGRSYQACLATDLFGDCVVWRGWCRADGKRGGQMQILVDSNEAGLRVLQRVARQRRQRGYQSVLASDVISPVPHYA